MILAFDRRDFHAVRPLGRHRAFRVLPDGLPLWRGRTRALDVEVPAAERDFARRALSDPLIGPFEEPPAAVLNAP